MRRGNIRTCHLVGSLGIVALLAVSACSSAQIVEPTAEELESDAKVSISPKNDADDTPVSSEVAIDVEHGSLTDFTVLNNKGEEVDGQLRPDGSSWVPAEPLKYDAEYSVEADAVDTVKRPTSATSTFQTMSKPSDRVESTLWNEDGAKYGKAMPVVLDFPQGFEVPEDKRAEVEKRLFVSSEPEQPGAWHWFNGTHLEYRPKDYWELGTKIDVRLGLQGLPLGDGKHGARDLTSSYQIDDKDREVSVSNKNKNMVAKEDGEDVKTMDISLGKPGDDSYSGTMVVMEKASNTTFDTTNEPGCGGQEGGDDCYRTNVDHAQRLTWTGQFIHSAPWSVGDQGNRNVSHGCVNMSPSHAKWVYDFTRVGTPVTVTGTGVDLPPGDGYGSYNLEWDEFLKGSYLPPPEEQEDEDTPDDSAEGN